MTDSLFPGAGRRFKVWTIPSQYLFAFMRGLDGRAAYRLYGMPEDTKCVGVTTSRDGEAKVVFLLESKDWPELDTNAAEIPEIQFQTLTALMPSRLEPPKTTPKFRKLE